MKKMIIALSALVVAACSHTDLPLENTQWKLVELNGDANPAFAEDGTFAFTLDGETINGVGACNRFFGGYELSERNGFKTGMMGMTRMACPNMDLEDAFVRMLDEADSYSIDGDTLVLITDGVEAARFKGTAAASGDGDNAVSEK